MYTANNREVLQPSQKANYIAALDLQKDPFSPEPDSLFYYSFDSFEQRLNVLSGLVQGSDLFVLVIGEPGSGKTTMLNRYLASTDAQWKSARLHTDPETAAAQSTKPQEHRGYPAYVLQNSADPIVIADDAHQLLPKELDFLIHEAMVPGSASRIKRLVLFGESELYTAVTKLAASLSAQPAVNKIYLPGLTEEETADYLLHRLAIAGFSGEIPLNSSEINHIHQTSGGYPGPINEIAFQWFNKKYSNKKEGQDMSQTSSATPRRKVAWIAAGVIIILVVALWLFSDRKPTPQKTSDQKLAKTVFRQKMPPNRESVKTVVAQKEAAANTSVKPATVIKPMPRPTATPSTKPQGKIQIDGSQKVKTVAPEKVTTGSLNKDSQTTTIQQQEVKPAQSKTEPKAAQTTTIQQQEAKPAQSKPEPKAAQTKTIQQQKARPAPVVVKSAAKEIRREKWLLSQDGTRYTVQVIGVSNEKSLLDFINRNQMLKQNEIAYYESTFRGKPWFQLLYGIYPDRQAARLAANKLPENIRQAGPWTRSIAAVQKAIENR